MLDANDDTAEFELAHTPKFDVCGKTDKGQKRDHNEDQFLIIELEKKAEVLAASFRVDIAVNNLKETNGLIMVVADGVGGAAAGERASQLVAEEILRQVQQHMPWFIRLHHEHEDELLQALTAAVRKCEFAIASEVRQHPDEVGMGTTLTLAYILWPSLYVVHVGDSRCYIFRDSKLLQVTRDHTYAQALLESGHLQEHEAKTSQFSNVLINSIGRGIEELHPEVYSAELRFGDQVVLCTDGLTKMLSNEMIGYILEQSQNCGMACDHLIQKANAAGGIDNSTVIVCTPRLEE